MLVLHRGEALPSDRLIDELWGERPPPTAAKIIQGYVSHLRRIIGDQVLITGGGGYLLRAELEQVDAERFLQLAADGRKTLAAGDATQARELLVAGLALWRGDALADFAYESFALGEIASLQESRLAALEDRIDADLALGGHREVVGELAALCRRYPNRERLLSQLMLALYRGGRQADALDAYRRGRQVLSDRLGLESSAELRALEQRILNHDPMLDLQARNPQAAAGGRSGAVGADVRPGSRAARLPGRWLLAGGGALLLAAVAATVAMALAGRKGPTVRVEPNSVAGIDVHSNQVTAAAGVGVQPGAIAYGAGSLWVANVYDQTISRVDPRTLQTLRTIPLDEPPTGVAVTGGQVWTVMSNPTENYVTAGRIDPQFDTLEQTVRVGNVDPATAPTIATLGDALWVAPQSGDLTRLDSESGAVRRKIDPDASPSGVALGAGAMWLTDSEADDVIRVDPTGLRSTIPVGDDPSGIVVGDGAVWVADTEDNAVKRIDPATQAVTTTISVGSDPLGVIVGAGSVWVADSGSGSVSRIDPRTNRVIATIRVGGSPQSMVLADGRVWVSVDRAAFPHGSVDGKGGTLRVDSAYAVDTMDPAIADSPLSWQLLTAGCAELLNYPERSGSAGSRLVPEVAQALPTISSDGRTYTFVIRRGFRFAPPSNRPVTAETFKDTIERTLNPVMKSPVATELGDVIGAKAYMDGRARRITGLDASGDRLTIRLSAPDQNLQYQLAQPFFCAVPPDTPVNANGVSVIPSAGPYSVVAFTAGRGVVVARNPNYHGNRPDQFARIELSSNVSPMQAITAVETGRADYADGGEIPAADANTLAARYGANSPAARAGHQQYFVRAESGLDFYMLNSHRALFSHERLREAVNYAIDRAALARLGDPLAAMPEKPLDHYLPPGIPGYRDIDVFPSKPDLARARRLAKGFAGSTVVLYTCDATFCRQQAQIVKTDLAAIGLRVAVKKFQLDAMFSREQHPGEPFDMAYGNWIADYPDPADFLNLLLEGGTYLPTLRDSRVRAELAAAAKLTGTQRYLTYGRLDQQIATNAAPLVAFGAISSHDFFSARIGCEVYSPVYGMELGALCLRRTARDAHAK